MAAKTRQPERKPSRFDAVLEWTVAGLGLAFIVGSVALVGKGALDPASPAAPEVRETGRRLTPQGLIIEVEVLNRGEETAAAVEIQAIAGSRTATATIDYLPGRSRRPAALALPPDTTEPVQLSATGWSAP